MNEEFEILYGQQAIMATQRANTFARDCTVLARRSHLTLAGILIFAISRCFPVVSLIGETPCRVLKVNAVKHLGGPSKWKL